jgi:hydrogenase maturation factor
MSRLHQVTGGPHDDSVSVRDIDGRLHLLSLLAYDGPPLEAGDWVVAQSGYALAMADPADAAEAVAELTSVRPEQAP